MAESARQRAEGSAGAADSAGPDVDELQAQLEAQLVRAWLQGYEAARGDVQLLLRAPPLRRPVRPLARLLRAAAARRQA